MQPTASDLHIDTYLSNVGLAYLNAPDAYIADRVFPVVPVNKRSDLYPIYRKSDWFRDEAKKRAPLTESTGGGFELEEPGTYYCHHWSYHKDYSDDEPANQDDVFDIEDDSTAFVVEKLKLRREREFATTYFQIGIWTSQFNGAGADFVQWDQAASNPISDMEDWKAAVHALTGVFPNTLIVPHRLHQIVKNNDEIVERYKYTRGGVITAEILASIFEIDRYIIGSALHAPNAEGDADAETLEYILDETSLLLVYAAPRPSKRRPSGGYTFRWKRPRNRGQSGERLPFTLKKWYMKEIEGTRVEGNLYEDMNLVAADCGCFCRNVWDNS